MSKNVFSALAISIALFYSCKKDALNSAATASCNQENLYVANHSADVIDGLYIVKLKNDALPLLPHASQSYEQRNAITRFAIEQLLLKSNLLLKLIGPVFSEVFWGFEARLNKTQLANLMALPFVESIEQQHRYTYSQTCNTPAFDLPNAQLEGYAIKRIGTGDGTGKRAWIIDTGIDLTHPDLVVNTTLSRNFVDNTLLGIGSIDANDGDGHGTHVAGIIGAKNNDFGTRGIAAGAELVAIKVLDNVGDGTTASVIQGLDYVLFAAQAGEVVNMSLGGAASALLDFSVQTAASKGILFALAAGNEGASATEYSPARANGMNIFTVSAIDELDRFASFSNFGNPPIDYAQPGVNIVSTWRNGLYKKVSGTSMAAPHLAGILLLKGTIINTQGTAIGDPDSTPDKIAIAK